MRKKISRSKFMNGCLNSNMNLYRSVHHPLRMFRRRFAAPSRLCSVTYQIIAQREPGASGTPPLPRLYYTFYVFQIYFCKCRVFRHRRLHLYKVQSVARTAVGPRRPRRHRQRFLFFVSVLPHSITSHSMSYIKLFIYRLPVLIKRTALLFGTQFYQFL